MPQVNCKICTKQFYAKPNHIIKGWGKFCSRDCQRIGQFKGTEIKCYTCEKSVYRSQAELRKSKSGKFFCGKSCQTIWRNSIVFVGMNHPNWKSGDNQAYRSKLIRSDAKKVCQRCGHSDKRVLVVHHIDRSHQNNSIDNLTWLCANCHYLVHNHSETI